MFPKSFMALPTCFSISRGSESSVSSLSIEIPVYSEITFLDSNPAAASQDTAAQLSTSAPGKDMPVYAQVNKLRKTSSDEILDPPTKQSGVNEDGLRYASLKFEYVHMHSLFKGGSPGIILVDMITMDVDWNWFGSHYPFCFVLATPPQIKHENLKSFHHFGIYQWCLCFSLNSLSVFKIDCSQWAHDTIITSLLRQNDTVLT